MLKKILLKLSIGMAPFLVHANYLDDGRDEVAAYRAIVASCKKEAEQSGKPYYEIHNAALAQKVGTLFDEVRAYLRGKVRLEEEARAASAEAPPAAAHSAADATLREEALTSERKPYKAQKRLKRFEKFAQKFREGSYMRHMSINCWNILVTQCVLGVSEGLDRSVVISKTTSFPPSFSYKHAFDIVAQENLSGFNRMIDPDFYNRGTPIAMLFTEQKPTLGTDVLTDAFLDRFGPIPVCFRQDDKARVHAGIVSKLAEFAYHDSFHFMDLWLPQFSSKVFNDAKISYLRGLQKIVDSLPEGTEDERVYKQKMKVALFIAVHETSIFVPYNSETQFEDGMVGDAVKALYDLSNYTPKAVEKEAIEKYRPIGEPSRIHTERVSHDERLAIYQTRLHYEANEQRYAYDTEERNFVFETEAQLQANYRDHAWLLKQCGFFPRDHDLKTVTLRELQAGVGGLIDQLIGLGRVPSAIATSLVRTLLREGVSFAVSLEERERAEEHERAEERERVEEYVQYQTYMRERETAEFKEVRATLLMPVIHEARNMMESLERYYLQYEAALSGEFAACLRGMRQKIVTLEAGVRRIRNVSQMHETSELMGTLLGKMRPLHEMANRMEQEGAVPQMGDYAPLIAPFLPKSEQ